MADETDLASLAKSYSNVNAVGSGHKGTPYSHTGQCIRGRSAVGRNSKSPSGGQGTASLQQAITSCTWRIEVLGSPPDAVSAAVAEALSASELWLERVRKGKTSTVDVRPTILELSIEGPTDHGTQLVAELATESVSLRPSELVEILGIEGLLEGRVRRTHQWTVVDGIRSEPVSPPNPSTGHEQELLRAS